MYPRCKTQAYPLQWCLPKNYPAKQNKIKIAIGRDRYVLATAHRGDTEAVIHLSSRIAAAQAAQPSDEEPALPRKQATAEPQQ